MIKFNLFDFRRQGRLRECWRCNKWFESYEKKRNLEYCSFCEEFYELKREVKKLNVTLKKNEEEKLEFEYFLISNYYKIKEEFLEDLKKKEEIFEKEIQGIANSQKWSELKAECYKNEVLALKQKLNCQNSLIKQERRKVKIDELECLNEELSII